MTAATTEYQKGRHRRKLLGRDIFRVASGNFVEMYDFMVFGYFASAIGSAYFPGTSSTGTLLKALATFGAGFLMRPLGAVILGAYTDHHGRRAGLILTLALMSVGIFTIAFTPGYAVIGVAAPLIVLLGRLLQGFSAGAELGTVSVYLAEIAPLGARGFTVAWQSASQQIAVIVAATIGIVLGLLLNADELQRWGWRVRLAIGCLILPLLFMMRRNLRESDRFAARPNHPSLTDISRHLWAGRGRVLTGLALVLMTTVSFYTITAYTPTFGKLLHLPDRANLMITALVGLSNLLWLPLMGSLSDRIGRMPILIGCTALAILTAYPAMLWLASSPSVAKLLIVEEWLSALYASYNAAMVVHLTEIVPEEAGASGFSLAYSLATAVGGFTPFIVTALITATGNTAVPGIWLTFIAAISFAAALVSRRYVRPNALD